MYLRLASIDALLDAGGSCGYKRGREGEESGEDRGGIGVDVDDHEIHLCLLTSKTAEMSAAGRCGDDKDDGAHMWVPLSRR